VVERGMVRLSLNVGKEHGIKPGDIVGSIAYHADFRVIPSGYQYPRPTLSDRCAREISEQALKKAGKYKLKNNRLLYSSPDKFSLFSMLPDFSV
jgi:hypothetical protein